MHRYLVIAALLWAVQSAPALAYCTEPSAPSGPRSYGPPSPPVCGSYGDLSGCSRWEVENYRNDLEAYMRDMRAYANDASDFADRVVDYANCEMDAAVDEWNRFIGR